MAGPYRVTPEEELLLRRQFDEALRQAILDGRRLHLTRSALQTIVQPTLVGWPPSPHDFFRGGKPIAIVEEHRALTEAFYRKLGFDIHVPLPGVQEEDFVTRAIRHQRLFYCPPLGQVNYPAFMQAVGQGDDWTLEHWTPTTEKRDRSIRWDRSRNGYWFWATICDMTSWADAGRGWDYFNERMRLLSLEEYVIVWWSVYHIGREQHWPTRMIDTVGWYSCWLRTGLDGRFLRACTSGCDQMPCIIPPRNISSWHDYYDHEAYGRDSEVVESVIL